MDDPRTDGVMVSLLAVLEEPSGWVNSKCIKSNNLLNNALSSAARRRCN